MSHNIDSYNKRPTMIDIMSAPRKDPDALLRLIADEPKFYLCADKSIVTDDFTKKAIQANRLTYFLLSKENKLNDAFITEYAKSLDLEWYSVPEEINIKKFYSLDAYQFHYEKQLLEGSYSMSGTVNDTWLEQNGHSIFVDMAPKVNPELKPCYDQIAHDTMMKHADLICARIAIGLEHGSWWSSKLKEATDDWMKETKRICPELIQKIEETRKIIANLQLSENDRISIASWATDGFIDLRSYPWNQSVPEGFLTQDYWDRRNVELYDARIQQVAEFIASHTNEEVMKEVDNGRIKIEDIVEAAKRATQLQEQVMGQEVNDDHGTPGNR